MKRTWRYVFLAAVVAGVVWRAPATSETRLAAPKRVPNWHGTGSCASAACHGATGPADDLRCSYSTWMEKDQHVHAFDVLLTKRSATIEKNYRRDTGAKAQRPEEDRLCLRCHSMDADAVLQGNAIASSDGIGCERCHGPAEHWLSRHYRRDWQTLSTAEKEALGYRPMSDLKTRATLCVECHIGSGDAQVDHDLYAAGHPPLNFELASYVATMPPHWNVRAEQRRQPDLQARLWAVGQLASAKASLELLAFRATEKTQPWPEFAEHSCRACHQDLRPDARGRALGVGLPWNEWSVVMLQPGKDRPAPLAGAEVGKMLAAISEEMGRPLPDRERVATQARSAARALTERLNELDRAPPLDAAAVRRQFDDLWKDRRSYDDSWDDATQCYLALAALHHAMTDLDPARRDPALREQLKAMAKSLRSPADFYRRRP